MAWLLHIIEGDQGRWSCSHGRHQLDSHDELTEALAHLRSYAATLGGPAEVVIHSLDGVVEKLGALGEI